MILKSVTGGGGNDYVHSETQLAASDSLMLVNTVDGGDGNDTIDSLLSNASTVAVDMNIAEQINGGLGQDVISATMFMGSGGATSGSAIVTIDGGNANDTITGRSEGTVGSFNILGGTGSDVIDVSSGSGGGGGNVLDGGAGVDTIIGCNLKDELIGGLGVDVLNGGLGDDILRGGSGALGNLAKDTFQFSATANLGSDEIFGFENDQDKLQFTGITDTGVAGVVDDIEALVASANDLGAGNDVVFTLTNGTVLTFDGLGTGAVATLSDLVDDPLAQLIA